MGKVAWFFALVAAVSLLLVGSLAWAKGGGGGKGVSVQTSDQTSDPKTPAGFSQGKKKGFIAGPNFTPKGWNSLKGKTQRKGWQSESMPPGLLKQ